MRSRWKWEYGYHRFPDTHKVSKVLKSPIFSEYSQYIRNKLCAKEFRAVAVCTDRFVTKRKLTVCPDTSILLLKYVIQPIYLLAWQGNAHAACGFNTHPHYGISTETAV